MTGYDFDKTIYDGDCFIDFYKYCLIKRPYLILYIPFQILLGIFTFFYRQYLKQFFASYLIFVYKKDDLIEKFWNKNMSKIKDWYFRQKKDDDIIISASPYFLLKPICNRIGLKNLIATDMDINTGIIKGKNCYGEQKVYAFKEKYPNIKLDAFYSDSKSDLYMIAISQHGYIITKTHRLKIK